MKWGKWLEVDSLPSSMQKIRVLSQLPWSVIAVVEEIHSFHQRMLIISKQSKRVVVLIFVKCFLWLIWNVCCLISHGETLRFVLRRSHRGQLRQVVLVGSQLLFTLDALLIRLLIWGIWRNLLTSKVIFKGCYLGQPRHLFGQGDGGALFELINP